VAIILPSATCRMACPHISLGDLVRSRILLRSHSCLLIEDMNVDQFIDLSPEGSSKIVDTTLATSLGEIGEVRAEPNGNLIVVGLE
jgi:hypothetical protein